MLTIPRETCGIDGILVYWLLASFSRVFIEAILVGFIAALLLVFSCVKLAISRGVVSLYRFFPLVCSLLLVLSSAVLVLPPACSCPPEFLPLLF